MSLKRRICCTVLVRNGQAVKGERFAADRPRGSPLEAIRVAQLRGMDEIVLLMVGRGDSGPDFDLVRQLADELRSPFAVGGGIRDMDDVSKLIGECGADKVVIGTWNMSTIGLASDRYGSQAVVASVALAGSDIVGRSAAVSSAMVDIGAGEILLQDRERDGRMAGLDIALIKNVCDAVSVPVIASGGAAGVADFHAAFRAGASAVSAGALWMYEDITPAQVKRALREMGWEVRV